MGFRVSPDIRRCLALVMIVQPCLAASLDLSKAALNLSAHPSTLEQTAARVLNEEIARRTQIRLALHKPSPDVPLICLGTVQSLSSILNDPQALSGLSSPESFRLWVDRSTTQARLIIAGADDRGVLYGVGYLLRKLELSRQTISLSDDFRMNSAPKMKLRGHQLGYRQKTNSYDGWDIGLWEQYIRDLAMFGCNAIELIPPRSDDDPDSPHFPLPPMEMMIEMSRLANEYGMDVWVWYPAMDTDYGSEQTVAHALEEWANVFRQLPRLDAVFVPGGDPGHTPPHQLFSLLEKQTASLHRYHPAAAMWVSPQSFGAKWLDEFCDLLKAEPPWLTGVVYGPQVRVPLNELRPRIPSRYAIRDYPDITHSRHCQYPVPDWDLAFALTEGREAINPRPTQMARIFRQTTLANSSGFISYSEGCNDDLNKAVWSALGWDPDADLSEVLHDYSRYFIGSKAVQSFTELLLGLEQNWSGAVETNALIEAHLELARQLEQKATPQQKLNWRFQQVLYRAYYDAYVRARLVYETRLENQALQRLAAPSDVLQAVTEAEAILDQAEMKPVGQDLRARIFELGEALFQSIRMQLSTERYLGEEGRGSNLNEIDRPLNNRAWLRDRFQNIRALGSETERLNALREIVRWREPGEGGFYDDLGDPRQQPHLVQGTGWKSDPSFFHSPQIGFTDLFSGVQGFPSSWWTSAESSYDQPLRLRYNGLDKRASYKLRVAYGKYKNNAPTRLVANEETEIHGWLNQPGEILEFPIPRNATAAGTLTLTWLPTPGLGGNGRVLDVAEVWLLKTE